MNFFLRTLVVLLFSFQFLNSQSFKNFSSLGGKKDLGVTSVAQNKEGVLWLGTKEGLIRFDGKTSLLLKTEDGLSANEISSLFIDSKNVLWVGHRNGKISLVKKNKADSFLLNPKMPENAVISFFEDKNANIFIGTNGGGLAIYNGTGLEKFSTENGLADDIVYTMAWDEKKYLWIGTDAGINEMDIYGNKTKIAHISTKDGLPDNIVRCIKSDGKGNLIIAMQDSGLCYYDNANQKFVKNPFLSSWNLGAITDVVTKKDGSLLISSENKGMLFISNHKLKLFDAANGLPSNNISKLFIDKEENLWVGTIRGISLQFAQRHTVMNMQMGLPSDKITSVLVDQDETVWASSEKGLGEMMLNETGNYEIKILLKDLAKEGAQVSCMLRPDRNRMFIGTYGKGIAVVETETGSSKMLTTKNGLANDNISFMCLDGDGNTWVSTIGGGISVIDNKTGSIKNYTEDDGLGSNYVYQVFCDSKKRIWAAVDGGCLELFDPDNKSGGKFTSLKEKLKIQSKTIYSIAEDSNGNIWCVTSDEGVIKYNPSTELKTGATGIKIYNTKNGLRDATPPIICSSGNKILLVHNKGIDVIEEGHQPEITYFDLSENDLEPNLNAMYTDLNGYSWFGTNNGVIKFRAFNIPSDSITPAAYLTNLKVQYVNFNMDSANEFSWKQNNMIFEFDATWLKAPDKIKFRYMLAGLEKDWQQITVSHIATYNNIPPGEYSFKVEACNEEGNWGKASEYKFFIATPIWFKWWFWVLVIVGLVVGIYSLVKYRLKALQKQNLILEQKVEERTAEIVEQTKVIEEKNKSLEQLSLVASKTDNVVLIMDANGKIEFINQSFIKLNGITLEELVKERGETIFEVSNHPQIRELVAEAVRDKKSVNYESLNILKSGYKVWESSTLTPTFNEKGELRKMIIIDTDVTERKRQEEIIVQKNRDITDSIQYAQKIQKAILPDLDQVKKDIPHSFILYLIKDIVSGDFYWYARKGDFSIIACVDCTGHGVPGAFMSMIGYNILNQVVNEKNITEPARILTELNKGVIESLNKKNPQNAAKDGMDAAICKVNVQTHQVEYSAAMRPLWIVKKSAGGEYELNEIKADKVPIGTINDDGSYHNFTNHSLIAEADHSFYTFTDGYADQFGGDKGKKLTTGRFKEAVMKIHTEPAEIQRQKLLDLHFQWKGEQEQVDDILVVGFKA
ncbi:MAG: SpoIIE family protein phosphatase [Bacteroidia bacterium]|nr:SpoIIE family protein phosphatase [Bacteroidia bacterium]